jgi:hypothetical protein
MRLRPATAAATVALLSLAPQAAAQSLDPSRKWEILDNSFLIEESFNQERGVVQNIFSWTRGWAGGWGANFTQEWPVPGTAHQLSYTLPFAAISDATGWGDVLLNYRYQLLEESEGVPAIAPRVSLILPTGRSEDGLGGGTYGIQFNLAASKQYGDFYVHGNAGFTWRPEVQRTPSLGASGIWRATPMWNVMLEAVVAFDESTIVSPGIRRGWNFGDHQLVVGAAVPFTRAAGDTSTAVLAYMSYELPFSR